MGLFSISLSFRRRAPTNVRAVKRSSTNVRAAKQSSANVRALRDSSARPSVSLLSFLCLTNAKGSKNVPQSPRRRRVKDLPAGELVDMLVTIDEVPSPDFATNLANHIASNDSIFKQIIHIAINPPDIAAPPRERNHRTWIIATLLQHGPPVLRKSLSQKPELIRMLSGVFEAPPGKLDATLAAHVADVLRIMLFEFPRETASALYRTKLVSDLIAHIHLQPAADLLPRLVGARIFTPLIPAPVIPMHKRAVAMMGIAHAQEELADRFVSAAEVLTGVRGGDKSRAHAVLEGCSRAMAEISARAMSLPRKREDADERGDVVYAGNLMLVTAHMYNDSMDHMDLFKNVEPLFKVLFAGLRNDEWVPEVLLPALGCATAVLSSLRETRKSVLPSVKRVITKVDTRAFAKNLKQLVPDLAVLLKEGGRVVGRVRMAVVDLLREACATLGADCLACVIQEDDFVLLRHVLDLAKTYRSNNILVGRVSHVLAAVFDHDGDLSEGVLRETDAAEVLHIFKEDHAMEAAFFSLMGSQVFEEVMQDSTGALREILSELEIFYNDDRRKNRHAGLLRSDGVTRAKDSSELAKDVDLENQLGANEDYGHELYIHHLIDEMSSGTNDTPPSDNIVAHAADEVNTGGKGLAWRLKEHGIHRHLNLGHDESRPSKGE